MKVAVIGPGAIGSVFYSLLSAKVKSLILIDNSSKRAESLKKRGLRVEGLGNKSLPLSITADYRQAGIFDLVIIAVKSYHTPSAAKAAKNLCGKEGYVLSLQNGLGNLEILSEVVGEDRVLGGVTEQAAILKSPGVVIHTAEGTTYIGSKQKKQPAVLRQVRELFNRCGIRTRLSKDINSAIWSKLVVNAGINALTALLKIRNGDILRFDSARKLMQMAVSEAERVAKRKRVRLSFDSAVDKTEAVCRATGGNISSMLQDVLQKKRTEVEYINGAIFRLGQNLNIPTPVNFMLFELVKTLETSYSRQVI